MWIKLAKGIIRFRYLILACIAIVTGLMYWQSRDVQMSYRMAEILPRTDKAYSDYQNFRKIFGEEANVVVLAVSDPEFFKAPHLKNWMQLEKSIRSIPKVDWTLSVTSSQFLSKVKTDTGNVLKIQPLLPSPPSAQIQADSVYQLVKNLSFYNGALWNMQKNSFCMLASLDKEIIHTKDRLPLVKAIQDTIKAYETRTNINVHISGLPFIRTDTIIKSKQEITLFVGLAALITSLILFILFRSLLLNIVALSEVGIGILWSSGLLGIFDYNITTLTGLIPPLLIVIGIPNAVYMITKYQQEFLKYGNKARALTRVLQKTGKAIFLTNLTTAIGFGTLIITGSKVLVEFGIVASITIMLMFILSITWITIMLSILPAPKPRHTRHINSKRTNFFIHFLVNLAANYRWVTYTVAFVLLSLALWGMTMIVPSGKVADDVPKHSETYKDLAYFEENFGGVMPFEIMIDTKGKVKVMRSGKMRRKVAQLQDSIATHPEFSRPVSYVELFKYVNQVFYNGDPKHYTLPSELDLPEISKLFNTLKQSVTDSLGKLGTADSLRLVSRQDSLLSPYIDTSGRYVRIRVQMKDMGTYDMKRLQQNIMLTAQEVFKGEDVEITLTGASVVILRGTEYLVKNLISSLLCAIGLIALIMAAMFRRFKMVIISLLPNILPLLFTAGVMGFSGIPLKASTCIIFGIAFGISVDDTIHYLAKYRQDLKHFKGDIRKAVFSSLEETGLSMAYTSIILFFGFSIFMFSDFGGTVALGVLVSFTLLVAMFTNLTVLPALLLTLQRKQIDKDYDKYESIEADDEETDQEETINT